MLESRLQLSVLSEDALNRIEETAYRLLAEVGISLENARAVEMLHGYGCRVSDHRVLIPQHVVSWAMGHLTFPKEVFKRDGTPAFTYGDGRVRCHNSGSLPFTYDPDTGERRPATLRDVADATRLLDALPNVDVVFPSYGPRDVPEALITLAATLATLHNTSKPIFSMGIDKPKHVPYIVEMAAACCGGMDAFRRHPTTTISVSPISPLRFTDDIANCIIATAESGAILKPLPCPILGGTALITWAGALAQQHAEALASFTIAAAARPSAPVVYASRISSLDLRTATSDWGGPAVGMTGACAAQLAHRAGIVCDTYGLATCASLLDPQFAYERLANALVPALAGADILSGLGSMDNVTVGSPVAAVIDDEIISLIKHIVAGCGNADEATLAFDVMKTVILRDGVFLAERHTVQQMRKAAVWTPSIGVGPGQDARSGIVAQASAQARELLQGHYVEPLPDDVSRHLNEIMERARCELLNGSE